MVLPFKESFLEVYFLVIDRELPEFALSISERLVSSLYPVMEPLIP